MYEGEVAERPPELDGCWSSWSETQTDNVVKSAMDSGVVKLAPGSLVFSVEQKYPLG